MLESYLIRISKVCCFQLLVAGMCPQIAWANPAATIKRPEKARFVSYDAALDASGRLAGKLTDAGGLALVRAPLVLYQGQKLVAQTRTDDQGQFKFHRLRGGSYQLYSVGRQAMVRAWTHGAAPPGVGETLLVVSDYRAIRGQYDLNSVLTSGVVPIVLVTAGAVAIPIIVSDNKKSSS